MSEPELDSHGPRPVVMPFEPAEPDMPDEQTPDRERRTWPCAEAERELMEATGEALDLALEKWQQAQARNNKRVMSAINRTREQTDMPEINTAPGEKFFAVHLKNGEWEEMFEHEAIRG